MATGGDSAGGVGKKVWPAGTGDLRGVLKMLNETIKTTETTDDRVLWAESAVHPLYTLDGVRVFSRVIFDANPDELDDIVYAEISDGVDVDAIIMRGRSGKTWCVFTHDPDVYIIDGDGNRVYSWYRLVMYSELPTMYAHMLAAWEAGTYADEEPEVIDYPEEMETIETLDSDDFGTLYSVRMDHMDMTVSVYVTDEGEEFYPSDWQVPMPKTCAEAADYEWVNGNDLFEA
jgi:hypothetical protein